MPSILQLHCITTREHGLIYIGNFICTYAEAYLEPNKYLRWKFSAEIVSDSKLWIVFVKTLHHRCPTEF